MRRVALAALLVLAACGRPTLTAGEVVGREYDDPDTWTDTLCVSYDKNGWCTVRIPQEHHDEAHWFLTIRGPHPDPSKNEWVTDRVEVTEREYHECRRDWHWPDCTPRWEEL